MDSILVNLKRFDVPTELGGLCPRKDPAEWAEWVIDETVRLGIGKMGVKIVYFFPEALLIPALRKLAGYGDEEKGHLAVGSQSVFREDIAEGGNFGAFTTNLPAAAASNMGCTWSVVGHSEERKDKFEILCAYDEAVTSDPARLAKANDTVSVLLNREAEAAYRRGLNVCFCVGETAEERGAGDFSEQQPRIREVLKAQLAIGLKGLEQFLTENELVIGYEPRWAIGPGKTPPGPDYIAFVSDYIKSTCTELYDMAPQVVYGGGLKKENAEGIAAVPSIDGGLVALTKFTQPIAFDPEQFRVIITEYLKGVKA